MTNDEVLGIMLKDDTFLNIMSADAEVEIDGIWRQMIEDHAKKVSDQHDNVKQAVTLQVPSRKTTLIRDDVASVNSG